MTLFKDPSSIPLFLEKELQNMIDRYNSVATSHRTFPLLKKIAYAKHLIIKNDYNKMAAQVYFYDNEVHKTKSNYNKLIVSLESQTGEKNLRFVYLYIEPSKNEKKLNFGLRFSSVKNADDESTIVSDYKKMYYKTHTRKAQDMSNGPKSKRDEIKEEHIFNHYHSGEFRYDTCVHFSIFLNKVLRDYLNISSYKEVNQQSPLGILFETTEKTCLSNPFARRVFFSKSSVDDLNNNSFIKVQEAFDSEYDYKVDESSDDSEIDFDKKSIHKIEFNPYLRDHEELIDPDYNDGLDEYKDSSSEFSAPSFKFSLPDDVVSSLSKSMIPRNPNPNDSIFIDKSNPYPSNIGINNDSQNNISSNENYELSKQSDNLNTSKLQQIIDLFPNDFDDESDKKEYLKIISSIMKNSEKNIDLIIFELTKILNSNLFISKKQAKNKIWFKKGDSEFPIFKLTHPGNPFLTPAPSSASDILDYEEKSTFIIKFHKLTNSINTWKKHKKQKYQLECKIDYEIYDDLSIYFEPNYFLKTFLMLYLTNFNFALEEGVEVRINNGDDNVTLMVGFGRGNGDEVVMGLKDVDNLKVLSQRQKDKATESAISEYCVDMGIDRKSARVRYDSRWLDDRSSDVVVKRIVV